MIPIEYIIANGQMKITFICTSCGNVHNNKASNDDRITDLDGKIAYWKKQYPNVIV